jgi:beta-lactam-binding protein with PASTA domain
MWRTFPLVHEGEPVVSEEEGVGPPPIAATERELDDVMQPPGTLGAPDLRGMLSPDARRIGRMSELQVWVVTHPTTEALWGRVVAQDPAPGVALRPGDTVTITVGARPAVVVPDVRGGEEAEMLAVLRDAGLRPERRVARRSDNVPGGHIVRTRPRAGAAVPHGTAVTYVVATPRPLHGKQDRRHERRVRARRLPDGSFLTLPSDD